MKQTNILQVTPELLIEALKLPKDTIIKDVRVNFSNDFIEIKLTSKYCTLVPEGWTLPYINKEELIEREEKLNGSRENH